MYFSIGIEKENFPTSNLPGRTALFSGEQRKCKNAQPANRVYW